MTLALLAAFGASLVLVAVGSVLFSEAPSTFADAFAESLSHYGFGFTAWWVPGAFFALLALFFWGFVRLYWWSYVACIALLIATAVFALNILAAFGAYLLVRLWPMFMSARPDRFRGVPEWRQMIAAGFLATVVFGSAVFRFSPVFRISALRVDSPPVFAAPEYVGPDARALERAERVLRGVRAMAVALEAAYERQTIERYPTTTGAVALADVADQFPLAVQASINELPSAAAIAYWSNGSGFLFFADLPIAFQYPKAVGVTLPNGMVVVRADGDATDDLDYDGLPDDTEARWQTSLVLADSDGDGFSDGTEVTNGFSPVSGVRVAR